MQGWDQVQELAEFLKFKYDYNVQNLLERNSVIEQKTLDREQRLNSIGKSYFFRKNITDIPEVVCLIDDVITTGSTIESCARVLKSVGIKKVFVVSLFTVDN